MEVGGARAARVGAEEDLGAIEAQRVVHGVEHLGGHQVPRQEHARAGEGRRPPPPGGTCRAGDVGRRHRRVAGAGPRGRGRTRRRRRGGRVGLSEAGSGGGIDFFQSFFRVKLTNRLERRSRCGRVGILCAF